MRWLVLSAVMFLILPGCSSTKPADRDQDPGEAYRVVDWPRLPDGFELGQVVGVAVDSGDRVHVFHRAGYDFNNEEIIPKPTIAVFDADTGELLDEWGESMFVVPHGLAVDANDHIWATDVGNDTVWELLPGGEVVRVLMGDER